MDNKTLELEREEWEKEQEWLKKSRIIIDLTKRLRYEIKKRAAIRNITMGNYIIAACVEAMKLEDSYNQ